MERTAHNIASPTAAAHGAASEENFASLSGLSSLRDAPSGSWAIITERHESATHAHKQLQFPAVAVGDARHWSPAFAPLFANFNLVIVPDCSQPSDLWAARVASDCFGVAAAVKILRLPGMLARDTLREWIDRAAQHRQLSRRAFLDLIDNAPDWRPSANSAKPGPAGSRTLPPKLTLDEAIIGARGATEWLVALVRILDAVNCPPACRPYPIALISAIHDLLDAPAGISESRPCRIEELKGNAPSRAPPLARSFSVRVGSYLPGRRTATDCSNKGLRTRARRAEAAFNQWQKDSGFRLVWRYRRITDYSSDPESLYRIPLVAAWCQALTLARQNPKWNRGTRNRAQAIRRAAKQAALALRPQARADSAADPAADPAVAVDFFDAGLDPALASEYELLQILPQAIQHPARRLPADSAAVAIKRAFRALPVSTRPASPSTPDQSPSNACPPSASRPPQIPTRFRVQPSGSGKMLLAI